MGRKKLLPPAKRETSATLKGPDLLTVAEVAAIFRVDSTTVRRWIKQGALEAVLLPHPGARLAYRVKWVTVESHLETQQDPAVPVGA